MELKTNKVIENEKQQTVFHKCCLTSCQTWLLIIEPVGKCSSTGCKATCLACQ